MPINGVNNVSCIVIVAASGSFTRGAELVPIGYGQAKEINTHHYRGLDEVAIYCISHPCPSRLNFEAATPFRMIGVDLIVQPRNSVVTKKNGPFDLLVLLLSSFNLKSEANQAFREMLQHGVACQTLRKHLRGDVVLLRPKLRNNRLDKQRR